MSFLFKNYSLVKAEYELRVPDSVIMNQFLDPTNQKFVTIPLFHELFIPKYDNFRIISTGDICLSICLELNEWDWSIKENDNYLENYKNKLLWRKLEFYIKIYKKDVSFVAL